MKKCRKRQIVSVLFIIAAILSSAGCSSQDTTQKEDRTKEDRTKEDRTKENRTKEDMQGKKEIQTADHADILIAYTGKAEELAVIIEEKTQGDKYLIGEQQSYPDDYPDDMDEYDIIYLGYTVSQETIPDNVRSFLMGYDFLDKTIIPFCTYSGSDAGTSVYDIGTICGGAKLTTGFAISEEETANAQEEITWWIQTLDMR